MNSAKTDIRRPQVASKAVTLSILAEKAEKEANAGRAAKEAPGESAAQKPASEADASEGEKPDAASKAGSKGKKGKKGKQQQLRLIGGMPAALPRAPFDPAKYARKLTTTGRILPDFEDMT